MGVRTRGLDIAINAKRQVADAAARAEAKGVVERWNEQLAGSRDMLWSPTIRAALIAGGGKPYLLNGPFKLTAAGWVSSGKGTPLAVTPLQWRPYVARPKKR
jgi:hypothetical protein